MNRTRILPLLLLTAFFTSLVAGQGPAVISGTVKDADGAVAPNVKVRFVADNYEKTVVTGDFGEYVAELPALDLTVKASSAGFCDAHRPRLNVTSGLKGNIDFIMFPCTVGNMSVTDQRTKKISERDVMLKPFSEKVWTLCSGSGKPFELLIQYGKATEHHDGSVEFRGFTATTFGVGPDGKNFSSTKEFPVTVMFSVYTMTSANVTIHPQSNRILFSENVKGNYNDESLQASEPYIQFCEQASSHASGY